MDMLPWGLAALAALAAVVGWLRASTQAARADAAEERARLAEEALAKLKQLKAPAPPPAEPEEDEPEQEEEASPPPPAPISEPTPALDPAIPRRAVKLIRQARDMARYMSLDKRQEFDGVFGYRVPIELDDEQAIAAFDYLRDADEDHLLGVVEKDGAHYLLVR